MLVADTSGDFQQAVQRAIKERVDGNEIGLSYDQLIEATAAAGTRKMEAAAIEADRKYSQMQAELIAQVDAAKKKNVDLQTLLQENRAELATAKTNAIQAHQAAGTPPFDSSHMEPQHQDTDFGDFLNTAVQTIQEHIPETLIAAGGLAVLGMAATALGPDDELDPDRGRSKSRPRNSRPSSKKKSKSKRYRGTAEVMQTKTTTPQMEAKRVAERFASVRRLSSA